MIINQELFDELLSNSLDILRLSVDERNKVFEQLLEMQKELVDLLNSKEMSKLKRRELQQVLKQANEIIGIYYGTIANSIDIPAIAVFTAESTSYAFEISLGLKALNMPSQQYLKSLQKDLLIQGAPQADWWRGQSADTAFKFASEVRKGLSNAETNQQIISRIVGKNGEAGVMDIARKNAASLVQTAVQSVANDARRETFKENSDIIKGIQQVSTLDSHTSLTCIAYSGAQWNLDFKPIGPKNKQLPYNGGCPRHFNCRSVEMPITKTFREMGIDIDEPKMTTRASEDGQISADTTFEGFLKRKGKSWQDDVLGKGRADLWRSGKITLRDLVRGNGRPLSLNELKELAKRKKSR